MAKYSYLIGEKINGITILGLGKKGYGKAQYLKCKCKCGKEFEASVYHIKDGHTKSCGSCIGGKDHIGKKYGKLTVVKFLRKEGRFPIYEFKCDCGNTKETNIYSVVSGKTTSCGCLVGKSTETHGMSGTRFYAIYHGIKKRCENEKYYQYNRYGGRGIKCTRKTFESFKIDMYKSYIEHVEKYGENNTTIDRINNDKNYSRDNCRWATNLEQNKNRTNTQKYTYKGEEKTLKERANENKLPYKRVYCRIKRFGWDIGKAITTPIRTECTNKRYLKK